MQRLLEFLVVEDLLSVFSVRQTLKLGRRLTNTLYPLPHRTQRREYLGLRCGLGSMVLRELLRLNEGRKGLLLLWELRCLERVVCPGARVRSRRRGDAFDSLLAPCSVNCHASEHPHKATVALPTRHEA